MKKHIKILLSISFVCGVTIYIGLYIHKWQFRKPLLEVYFFSLERGRAIFVRTPQNKTILIGAGQNSQVIREITRNSPFYNRKIDKLIIPSALPNQIGGALEIIDRYEVEEIWIPKVMATSTVLSQLKNKINKEKISARELILKDSIEVEDGLKIEVIFPDQNFKFNKTSLPELGLYVSYGDTGLYLLGNLSKTIQKYILKNNQLVTSNNIIEYYHSANESKVSTELYEKIKPKYIFSTKEKAFSAFSDGVEWNKN